MNEVRMLCNSILHGHGILCVDKAIKYRPETPVLKLAVGDEIQLDEATFARISGAFFAAIEQKLS